MDNDSGESPVHRDSRQPVPQECAFIGAAPIHNEDGTRWNGFESLFDQDIIFKNPHCIDFPAENFSLAERLKNILTNMDLVWKLIT
jgi:hypothetical protein